MMINQSIYTPTDVNETMTYYRISIIESQINLSAYTSPVVTPPLKVPAAFRNYFSRN